MAQPAFEACVFHRATPGNTSNHQPKDHEEQNMKAASKAKTVKAAAKKPAAKKTAKKAAKKPAKKAKK